MFVIDPGKECKFFPGFGNGKNVNIGRVGDQQTCVNKVKKMHPTANAATFGRKTFTNINCFAVFNAKSRNRPNNEYETCIFGGNLFL